MSGLLEWTQVSLLIPIRKVWLPSWSGSTWILCGTMCWDFTLEELCLKSAVVGIRWWIDGNALPLEKHIIARSLCTYLRTNLCFRETTTFTNSLRFADGVASSTRPFGSSNPFNSRYSIRSKNSVSRLRIRLFYETRPRLQLSCLDAKSVP